MCAPYPSLVSNGFCLLVALNDDVSNSTFSVVVISTTQGEFSVLHFNGMQKLLRIADAVGGAIDKESMLGCLLVYTRSLREFGLSVLMITVRTPAIRTMRDPLTCAAILSWTLVTFLPGTRFRNTLLGKSQTATISSTLSTRIFVVWIRRPVRILSYSCYIDTPFLGASQILQSNTQETS